jgi:hypothetical protein
VFPEYIYTNELKEFSPQPGEEGRGLRCELIRLADQYQLTGLYRCVTDMIVSQDLSLRTCFGLLDLSATYGGRSMLKEQCMAFFKKHLQELRHTDGFSEWVRYADRDLMVDCFGTR